MRLLLVFITAFAFVTPSVPMVEAGCTGDACSCLATECCDVAAAAPQSCCSVELEASDVDAAGCSCTVGSCGECAGCQPQWPADEAAPEGLTDGPRVSVVVVADVVEDRFPRSAGLSSAGGVVTTPHAGPVATHVRHCVWLT